MFILSAACAFALAPAARARQPAPASAKLAALIVTGQSGHDWRSTTPALRKILEDTGRFDVRVTEEFRGATAETLAPYDVVIVNYFERGRPELRWGVRTEAALADFVRSGKGLVIYHFAVAAFDGWAEYEKLAAGMWAPSKGYGHHSARHDFIVDIADPDHPITRGLKGSLPQTNDELYANLRWQPAGSYHVLATAWDDHVLYQASRTDAKNPQPISGAGLHQPVAWTVNHGTGRVFTTVLGHDVATIETATFTTLFSRGAEWAAAGSVTLPIPAALAR
jgi:type 1 glutamine amidotransferase